MLSSLKVSKTFYLGIRNEGKQDKGIFQPYLKLPNTQLEVTAPVLKHLTPNRVMCHPYTSTGCICIFILHVV